MSGDELKPVEHESSSSQQNISSLDHADAELIAYYDEQRKTSRSSEWIGCLDATIRQLRRG